MRAQALSRGRAIVLLSGGIDSAVALHWARAEGFDVRALSFGYHARAAREIEATAALAAAARVPLETIGVPFLREIGDMDVARAGPVPSAYVPGRNAVFYAIAAARAEAVGARAIVGGHVRTDPDGFPDSSPEFFAAFARALAIGSWSARLGAPPVELLMPLAGLSKTAVIKLGLSLGVPLALTFSCYGMARRPCGGCPSCEERGQAFAELGVPDPARADGCSSSSDRGPRGTGSTLGDCI